MSAVLHWTLLSVEEKANIYSLFSKTGLYKLYEENIRLRNAPMYKSVDIAVTLKYPDYSQEAKSKVEEYSKLLFRLSGVKGEIVCSTDENNKNLLIPDGC